MSSFFSQKNKFGTKREAVTVPKNKIGQIGVLKNIDRELFCHTEKISMFHFTKKLRQGNTLVFFEKSLLSLNE